jgi:hypothetical protein
MKDPEKFGLANSVAENLDDMTIQTKSDPKKLMALMQLLKDMYGFAKPYIDPKSKTIKAPKGQIPTKGLNPALVKIINTLDCAFIETLSYTEHPQVFVDSYHFVKKKLDSLSRGGGGFGERVR